MIRVRIAFENGLKTHRDRSTNEESSWGGTQRKNFQYLTIANSLQLSANESHHQLSDYRQFFIENSIKYFGRLRRREGAKASRDSMWKEIMIVVNCGSKIRAVEI